MFNQEVDISIPTISDVDYKPIPKSPDRDFNMSTGVPVDYACFAIWGEARSRGDEIVEDLGSAFDILDDLSVYWSDHIYARNIARLYERSLRASVSTARLGDR